MAFAEPSRRILAKQTVAALHQPVPAFGILSVTHAWLVIAAVLFLISRYPNPLIILLGLMILGGRQLGLAILMHEAAHGLLTKDKGLNDFLGQWFCAAPVLNDLFRYRKHHLRHHRFVGTPKDPDLSLVHSYPCSERSLLRKFLRDLLGFTGVKRIYGHLLMHLEIVEYTVAAELHKISEPRTLVSRFQSLVKNSLPTVITNLCIFVLCWLAGSAWLYGIWVLSYSTFFSLFIRIRSIAEHAVMDELPDIERNTRTVKAGLIARVLVAPYHVNYHFEHHLYERVPHYRLPSLHRHLKLANYVYGRNFARSYRDVLMKARI